MTHHEMECPNLGGVNTVNAAGAGPRLREGEVHEYLTAFQRSSDRARYALYVVTIATVLIGIANYNVQPWAWPRHRLSSWYAVPTTSVDPFFKDQKQLEIVREEYAKQFASRAVLTSSPIPGVSIDVNDVGLIGGIALVLLMLVQRLCVVREHENLFLALYKVRRLCADQAAGPRGDNDANLLYHALAMSQVISSPPTLARWQRRGILSHLNLVFFFPTAVYGWVLYGSYKTIERAKLYGVDVTPLLIVQTLTMMLMIALARSSWVHSRAMSERWEAAFFRVNPQLRHVNQPTRRAWLRMTSPPFADLVRPGRIEAHAPGRLAAELLDNVVTMRGMPASTDPLVAEVWVEVSDQTGDINNILRKIFDAGLLEAASWCVGNGELERLMQFTATRNVIEGGTWCVAGSWLFSYRKNNRTALDN